MIARLVFVGVLLLPLACVVGALVVAVAAYVAEWMTEDRSPARVRERATHALRKAVGA